METDYMIILFLPEVLRLINFHFMFSWNIAPYGEPVLSLKIILMPH